MCFYKYYIFFDLLRDAKIESPPAWDTSWLAELIHNLINRQFLCGKSPKPVDDSIFTAGT